MLRNRKSGFVLNQVKYKHSDLLLQYLDVTILNTTIALKIGSRISGLSKHATCLLSYAVYIRLVRKPREKY